MSLAMISIGMTPTTQPAGVMPLVVDPATQFAVIGGAYVLAWLTSGMVVRFFLGKKVFHFHTGTAMDIHMVIGKCENTIAVTCALFAQLDALGLIFAAKTLVRRRDIKNDPAFFLGGTLVNIAWSLLVGFVARLLVAGLKPF